jgi:uncharacterized membrane protein (GlpM family)
MTQLVIKALVSGVLVAVASEAGKRSSLLGAILISLPLTSILALAWLYSDTRDATKVSDMSWSILWIVLPSIVFFIALPLLIRAGWDVPLAIVGAAALTARAYWGWTVILRRFGVDL